MEARVNVTSGIKQGMRCTRCILAEGCPQPQTAKLRSRQQEYSS